MTWATRTCDDGWAWPKASELAEAIDDPEGKVRALRKQSRTENVRAWPVCLLTAFPNAFSKSCMKWSPPRKYEVAIDDSGYTEAA